MSPVSEKLKQRDELGASKMQRTA